MKKSYQPMFPKPGKRSIPVVRQVENANIIGGIEREIINLKSKAGREEMKRRHREAWERDFGRCGICKLYVPFAQSVADHIIPKGFGGSTGGGANHNDMTYNLQPSHWHCNNLKGSRRDFELDTGRTR